MREKKIMSYSHTEKEILLGVAKRSILHGLTHHGPLSINLEEYPDTLKKIRAVFVTLEIENHLRGCIGTLQAVEPTIKAVACYAFEAAFRDPRFPPVTPHEIEKLDISISILTPPEPMTFTSEKNLIEQLRPSIDGLILTEGKYSGTFLPSVWSQLPDSKLFLAHLKMKAGLPHDYWSTTIQIKRYTSEVIK
jgi:AmmeMemoRadiSam system protein A